MEVYRSIDPGEIVVTAERLSLRIDERFPGSGLASVSRAVFEVARAAHDRAGVIARPMLGLRAAVAAIVALLVAALVGGVSMLEFKWTETGLGSYIQVLEAGLNDLVLIGAAVFFLVTVEVRVKRRRALGAIHELRSMAHVIDMHQLAKDPSVARVSRHDTASSPKRPLSRYELVRYLDYCSELLSLLGKVAALYVQHFDDAVAVAAVNDVEGLTTGLSRKIWQKIMILQSEPRE